MPTADELRSAIADGRQALKEALAAAAAWERQPAGTGEAT